MRRTAALFGVAGAAAAAAGLVAGVIDGPIERQTESARFHLRGHRVPSDRIVVVAYDNRTLSAIGKRPPIPRSIPALVVDNLDRAGAAVVAFDFSLEQSSRDAGADRKLALALMNTRSAVVSVTAPAPNGTVADLAGFLPIADTGVRPGYTPLHVDPEGVVRTFQRPPRGLQNFGLAAAEEVTGKTGLRPPEGALIDFPGPTGTFPQLSFEDVLRGRFPSRAVQGKIAIVGPTATVFNDGHHVPVDSTMPGAEIHAAEISTALEGFPLRRVSEGASSVITALLALLVPLLAIAAATASGHARRVRHPGGALLHAPGPATVVAVAAITAAAWLVTAQMSFNSGRVVELTPGLAAVLTSALTTGGAAHLTLASERRHLRRRFAARDPGVVAQVLAGNAGRRTLSATDVVAGYRLSSDGTPGGMGVVYRAEQLRLGREVAVKLIRPRYALDTRHRRRFVGEAHRAAGLSHPNIVPVFDAGEVDGVLYIVMQYVDGWNLGEWLRGSATLEPTAAVQLLHRVACALDYAFECHGIIHRDVKPANILVPRHSPRHPLLTDFGVAGLAGQSHEVAGTAAYQPRRGAGTRSGDVYALAAVLQETLTGQRPTQLTEPPYAAPPVPRQLAGIIARGLAHDPARRYERAADLTRDAAASVGAVIWDDFQMQAPAAPTPGLGGDGCGPVGQGNGSETPTEFE